jgi:protein arginine N-methyltransferase 5
VLYGDITMSITPKEKSEDMNSSWFPIYFPSMKPIEIFENETLTINIERINDNDNVWYSWNFSKKNQENFLTEVFPLQNFNGEKYKIKL